MLAGISLASIALSALSHADNPRASAALLGSLASQARLPAAAAEPASSGMPAVLSPTVPGAAGQASGGPVGGRAPVIVLDNTGRPELAANAATGFEQGGWVVTETSAFDGEILSTAAYYDPATQGAQAAAEALRAQFPVIQRVLPKFEGLPSGPIVVVLTYDYSQQQITS